MILIIILFITTDTLRKIKKRLLVGASSGVLASMLLFGGNAYAQVATTDIPYKQMSVGKSNKHIGRRWNSASRITSLANQLGINSDEVRNELRLGKTPKQILQEHGVDTTELAKLHTGLRKNKHQGTDMY